MTTIAFDGLVLAADRQAMAGDTPLRYPFPKVAAVQSPNGRRCLFGFSGPVGIHRAWLNWLGGADEPKWDGQSWSAILVDPSGYAWTRSSTSFGWEQHGRKIWAIGSGCNYALGAMAVGAGAVDAVRAAAKLDVYTGMGVDRLEWRRG